MKTLKQYLRESFTATHWETITDPAKITLGVIQNAVGHGSFMDDRAYAIVDGNTYEKLGKNRWQKMSTGAHVLSGTITDQKMLEVIQAARDSVKLSLPV